MKRATLYAFSFIFCAFFAINNVSAQDSSTGTVTLNIKLHPIQTLLVNVGQQNVDLDYVTKEHYANGVKSNQVDHLSVYSTGAFTVSAKAQTATFVNGSGDEIPVNTVKLTSSKGSNGLVDAAYGSYTLSNQDQAIVTSETGGVDKKINIEYAGAGADTYVNNYKSSETPTIYTTTITYTILAK